MIAPSKLAATLLLTASLAGCVDIDLAVDLTSTTTATATMTQVMNADFYTLTKMNEAETAGGEQASPAFCAVGELTENIDGTATCLIVEEGPFANLDLGQDAGGITFTPDGEDQVRIALSTDSLLAEAVVDEELDDETRELVVAFFTGRSITITFSGVEVIDTNMTLAEDETSASQTIPLLDLMSGEADLPEQLYAVIRAP